MKDDICPSQQHRDAFSLIEVMVASAVLSIVMAILLGTLSTSMSLWRNTENKLSADREGRAAELLIVQDLGNALMPDAVDLWPQVTNANGKTFLRFLTTRPIDYQRQDEGNVGDVCFVQYYFSPEEGALFRTFNPSAWTYTNVILEGEFPQVNTNDAQLVATNLLADASDAVRGVASGNLKEEVGTNAFVVLATNNTGQSNNLLPIEGNYTRSNPPVAVEVNFGVADPEAIANKELLENRDYKLRNAGFYSFRIPLPS